MVKASCGQILANQISAFPTDVDQLPKYGSASVTGYCLSMPISYL